MLPGGFSEAAPPVPIPNTEVKRLSADDTAWVTGWENRSPPGGNSQQPLSRNPIPVRAWRGVPPGPDGTGLPFEVDPMARPPMPERIGDFLLSVWLYTLGSAPYNRAVIKGIFMASAEHASPEHPYRTMPKSQEAGFLAKRNNHIFTPPQGQERYYGQQIREVLGASAEGFCRWPRKKPSALTTTISGLNTYSSALSARRKAWRPGCCPASPSTSQRCVPQSSSSSGAARSQPRAKSASPPGPRRWWSWRWTKPAA